MNKAVLVVFLLVLLSTARAFDCFGFGKTEEPKEEEPKHVPKHYMGKERRIELMTEFLRLAKLHETCKSEKYANEDHVEQFNAGFYAFVESPDIHIITNSLHDLLWKDDIMSYGSSRHIVTDMISKCVWHNKCPLMIGFPADLPTDPKPQETKPSAS